MSLTPGDPSIWPGVIFIPHGPYASAVLRLKIFFPSTYPSLPPLVTFATDIFHPLLTPLTTYTYTTGSADTDTVSATDDERLPPGGFSLRHGFPQWYGRSEGSEFGPDPASTSGREPSVVEVLQYLRSTFDDAAVLDSIPLRAAGNPGAWHAWRSHRAKALQPRPDERSDDNQSTAGEHDDAALAAHHRGGGAPSRNRTRLPGEWDWEGVWEERAKKGIDGSVAEPVLYGNAVAGDDLIRFLNMNRDMVATLTENIKRSVELSAER